MIAQLHADTSPDAPRGPQPRGSYVVLARLRAPASRALHWRQAAPPGDPARALAPGRRRARHRHSRPTTTGGLPPAVVRQPAVRCGRSLIEKVLTTHRLEAGNRDPVDFGASQRPRRSVAGIAALIAGARDDQQGPAGRHDTANLRHSLAPARVWQGLKGHALPYKIECMTPGVRLVKQASGHIAHGRLREPPPRCPDRTWAERP